MGLSIVHFRGSQIAFLNYDVFLILKVVLVLANSADPDEMQHYAAFHLGLHFFFFEKYPFRGYHNTKGLSILILQSCCGGGESCLLCFD